MKTKPRSWNAPRVLIPLLLAITGLGAVDFVLDDYSSPFDVHIAIDLLIVVVSFAMALYLWLGWREARDSLQEARGALRDRAAERDRWRRQTEDLLRGLGEAMDEVFESWELTPAERETAVLILKGHSHKRIARMTDRSERTVRQHAVAVYRKSGLEGRAALSGFFLEQLMLPEVPLLTLEKPTAG